MPPKLSEKGWSAILQRANERNIWERPCPICHVHFKLDDQVILSCSHVFHRDCLKSFESFSRVRICPICRTKDYEKLKTNAGNDCSLNRCALMIQNSYRSYCARKKLKHLRETVPPRDKTKRKEFYFNKFERMTKTLSEQVCSESHLEAFFHDLDLDLQHSKNIFAKVEQSLELNGSPQEPHNWQKIRIRADELDAKTCSICLQDLLKKQCSILNCAHIFHDACINSFEKFSMIQAKHHCPLCRSSYERILF